MKCSVLALAFILGGPCAYANPWEGQMDLLSAGAAASVVLHHACVGDRQAEAAAIEAARRLKDAAMSTLDPEGAFSYASAAYEMKVRALWQSTGGVCGAMQRLQDITRNTGFLSPGR